MNPGLGGSTTEQALKKMMLKMGFAEVWVNTVNTVIRCVISVSYKVKLNGDLIEEFIPECGLRQGNWWE